MHESLSVAVIGAGIAGIACAATLRDHGINVKVFDKGRAIGGRMATRRVSGWQWDHGTQYMIGDDPLFKRLVEGLSTWAQASADAWHVGQPSQNQLVEDLAQGIDLTLGSRISSVQREGKRWAVQAEHSSLDMLYDAIAVAIPATQAHELLPHTPAFADLHHVQMDPCWALMVASRQQADLPVTLASPHEHIAWIAADHTKPGRPQGHGQYVLHATAAWSERHLQCSNETVRQAMLTYFQEIAGPVEISYAAVHRWRYALTRAPLEQPCLLDAANRIGACGDWCLGERVEHGFLSGTALGERLAEILRQ